MVITATMKVLLQRVTHASVKVDEEIIGSCSAGLLLLVGFGKDDSESNLKTMAEKLIHLRVFPDENGRFHHSVLEIGGEILAVPQFTLYGETNKGRRPDFFNALHPDQATELFDQFAALLSDLTGKEIATGQFGAHMQVALENDGPVTLLLEY